MASKLESWISVKENIIKSKHKIPFYKEGEVWWTSVGYNVGFEVYGKGKTFARPVLIFKKFNQHLFIGIPMSTQVKDNPFYLNVILNNQTVSVLLSQIRSFSTKRMESRLGQIDKDDYRIVCDEVGYMLKLPPSTSRGSRG